MSRRSVSHRGTLNKKGLGTEPLAEYQTEQLLLKTHSLEAHTAEATISDLRSCFLIL